MVKVDKPNNPKQAIKMAIHEETIKMLLCFCSDSYRLAYLSSKNLWSKGNSGENFFQMLSIFAKATGTFPEILIEIFPYLFSSSNKTSGIMRWCNDSKLKSLNTPAMIPFLPPY